MENNKIFYFSAAVGAVLMMLLRICCGISILPAVLAIAGMAALIYYVRHANSKKEYAVIACTMAVTKCRAGKPPELQFVRMKAR